AQIRSCGASRLLPACAGDPDLRTITEWPAPLRVCASQAAVSPTPREPGPRAGDLFRAVLASAGAAGGRAGHSPGNMLRLFLLLSQNMSAIEADRLHPIVGPVRSCAEALRLASAALRHRRFPPK